MQQEFLIHPQKCKAQNYCLDEIVNNLKTLEGQLEDTKRRIGNLDGAGYSAVLSSLAAILEQMKEERKCATALKEALEKSVQLYIRTELKISSMTIDKTTNSGKIKDTWNSILGDIIGNIADFRGSEVMFFVESLLTKGIFKPNVINHLDEILGGTYISSYWENGSLKLKLNSDGFTNRQAAEWLSDNLGGTWDDYKARNMNRSGFSVYDQGSGSTRQMRYFDDITDADLSNYLKTVSESGKFAWAKTMNNTFWDSTKVWDDFNISSYKQVGTIGKVGKGLGAVGTVLTVGGDVVDNFYNPETKEWSFSGNQLADCTVDVGVDVLAGAGSAAAGAAVGSFFAPPVGTVVGAGVGIAVDVVANNVKLVDVDGDGQKDSLVDTVKIGGHWLVDQGEKAVDAVADWGSEMVDDIGGWFSETFSF